MPSSTNWSRRQGTAGGFVALAGMSIGGYFAARTAAHDRRVQALVADSPLVDLYRYFEAFLGPEVFRMHRDIRPEDVAGIPEDLLPAQMLWGIAAVCRRFGVASLQEWKEQLRTYRLGPALSAVSCPVAGPGRTARRSGGPAPGRRIRRRGVGAGDHLPLFTRRRGRRPLSGQQSPLRRPGRLRLARRSGAGGLSAPPARRPTWCRTACRPRVRATGRSGRRCGQVSPRRREHEGH